MNVLLIDLDGKMENVALMRISAYHKDLGDAVKLIKCKRGRGIDIQVAMPNLLYTPDKVYLSCVFRWNASLA